MTSSVFNDVFCDWLDTTYSPGSPVITAVHDFASYHGASCIAQDDRSTSYRVGSTCAEGGGGVLRIDTRFNYTRVSASGRVLAYLRAQGVFMDFLSDLACDAHTVTRLDAALDLPEDGATSIARLRSQFSGGACTLGRKALPVTYLLGTRADGRETGTFYAGHRSRARQTARVYDKAWEALQQRGELMPATTRYEVTARGEKGREGPCLRDAAEPSRLFWHIAAPALLPRPKNVPEWSSGWSGGWHYERPAAKLPAEVLVRHVDASTELASLIARADAVGPEGRRYLLRLLQRRILGSADSGKLSAGRQPIEIDSSLFVA